MEEVVCYLCDKRVSQEKRVLALHMITCGTQVLDSIISQQLEGKEEEEEQIDSNDRGSDLTEPKDEILTTTTAKKKKMSRKEKEEEEAEEEEESKKGTYSPSPLSLNARTLREKGVVVACTGAGQKKENKRKRRRKSYGEEEEEEEEAPAASLRPLSRVGKKASWTEEAYDNFLKTEKSGRLVRVGSFVSMSKTILHRCTDPECSREWKPSPTQCLADDYYCPSCVLHHRYLNNLA